MHRPTHRQRFARALVPVLALALLLGATPVGASPVGATPATAPRSATAATTPDEILVRLDRPGEILRGGRRDMPERHRALRATVAGSVELLSGGARRRFGELGVLGSPFSRSSRTCTTLSGNTSGPDFAAAGSRTCTDVAWINAFARCSSRGG